MEAGRHVDEAAETEVREVLSGTRRIAVVGASDRPDRASNHVLAFLVAQGFDVTPVNPGLAGRTIHGRPVVASLAAAAPLDMVDIFRNAEAAGPVVDEAIRLGARSVWMQLGVVNETAAARARAAGLRVVMDRCPAIEMPRLGLAGPRTRTEIPAAEGSAAEGSATGAGDGGRGGPGG